MHVFISWSGHQSRQIAAALRDWLKKCVQTVEPWMSEQDIESGARWSDAIASQLKDVRVGIVCVTPENKTSPWLHFEAGAISKTIEDAYVCPYLYNLEPTDLVGPLSQFQARKADREGTCRLLSSINSHPDLSAPLSSQDFNEAFDLWWPKLREKLQSVPAALANQAKKRPVDEVVTETLDLVRELLRVQTKPLVMNAPSTLAATPDAPHHTSRSVLRLLLENTVTTLPLLVAPHLADAVKKKATRMLFASFPDDDVFLLALSYVVHGQAEEGIKALSVLTGCTPREAKGAMEHLSIVAAKAGVPIPPADTI